jgi:ankyrin repeat protein
MRCFVRPPVHSVTRRVFLATNAATAAALLRHGVNINARNNGNATPLHYAEDVLLVRLFVQNGADVNALSSYGHTPLHLVASKGMWEVVWFLLFAGVNTLRTFMCV